MDSYLYFRKPLLRNCEVQLCHGWQSWCRFVFKIQSETLHITETRLYNFDPLKTHCYIVKLGFTGVYIIFLISAQKHRLWVLVRTASPRRGGSNEYPQSMFWAEIWKISEFLSENFPFFFFGCKIFNIFMACFRNVNIFGRMQITHAKARMRT